MARHESPEAVLIKDAEGVNYVAILQDLKKRVKPEELNVTVQGIKETRYKDLLLELGCSKKDRGWLDSTLKKVIVKADLFATLSLGLRWRFRTSNPALRSRMLKRL